MPAVFRTSDRHHGRGLIDALVVLSPGYIFYISYESVRFHPELNDVTRFIGATLDEMGWGPMERVQSVEVKLLLPLMGLPFDFAAGKGDHVQWSMPEERSPYLQDYAIFALAEHTTGASDETSTRAIRAAIA